MGIMFRKVVEVMIGSILLDWKEHLQVGLYCSCFQKRARCYKSQFEGLIVVCAYRGAT